MLTPVLSPASRTYMQLAISAGGALLFSVYLVFDIQLLMGSGTHALSPDEYVYGALALYLDVLNLFLYILRVSLDTCAHVLLFVSHVCHGCVYECVHKAYIAMWVKSMHLCLLCLYAAFTYRVCVCVQACA